MISDVLYVSNLNFIILDVISLVSSFYRIHEMKYDFTNISELGVAALNNSYEDIDDLVSAGCDINYNGTSFYYDIVYDNDYQEAEEEVAQSRQSRKKVTIVASQ